MTQAVEIGTIWDRTAATLREAARPIAAIALPAILVPQLVSALARGVGQTDDRAVALLAGAIVLAASLVALWGQLAVTAFTVTGARAPAVRIATRRLPAMVGVSLVLLAAFAALLLPALLILIGGGFDPMAEEVVPPAPASIAWAVLYLLLLAPLLLWLAARLLPTTACVLFERRGLGAIARAFRLTRGHGAGLAGALLLFAVVSLVAITAARLVVGSILALAFGGDGPWSAGAIGGAIGAAAVSAALAVVQAVFIGHAFGMLAERSPA